MRPGKPSRGGLRAAWCLVMYGVYFHSYGRRPLRASPQHIKKRIATKMRFFARQPDPLAFAEPLSGSSNYRFRIGDYRIIFKIFHGALWVKAIKRRDKVYN
jgi:mRNA-degrading endonuclease RelE of RelBE toxin-antitoxin system